MAIDPVSLGIKIALMAAQMALTASQRIKGPRLDSLDVSTADYGTPIPRFWGKRRLTPAIIWAEKLREVKHTSKTKGGKYDEYKYYATFAVLIADHPIDALGRLWLDKHLALQLTGAGPVSAASAVVEAGAAKGGGVTNSGNVKLTNANFRAYLGTEDQEPDARMVAWCEDRYGPDSCPAYRGCSYLVFEEIPVEKFGNRIPQVSVEVFREKSTVYPYEQRETTGDYTTGQFAVSGTWMAYYTASTIAHIEWWDLANRKRLGMTSAGADFATVTNLALGTDGTAYYYGPRSTGGLGVTEGLFTVPPMGTPSFIPMPDGPFNSGPCRVLGGRVFGGKQNNGYLSGSAVVDHSSVGRDFFIDADGDVWGIFEPAGASTTFNLFNIDKGVETAFTRVSGSAGVGSPKGCYIPKTNEFFVCVDGYFYRIDAATMAIVASGVAPWGENDVLPSATPGPISFWNYNKQYSLLDGSLLQTVDFDDWTPEFLATEIYDPVNDAALSRGSLTSHLTWRYLNRVGSNGTQLRTIVEEVAGWCGLTDVDATDLDQLVLGYSVTQGSGKDMISPLLDIHDSDARPHGFTVQFRKRGQASLGTLLTSDFVVGSEPRYKATVAQDTDIPRRITLNFADDGKDQQTNTVVSQRPLDAVSGVREQQIDMTTYASTPPEAQQFADRYFRRQWNGRETIECTISAQQLALEPGDVRSLSLDGLMRNARCTKWTFSADAIKTEWIRDERTLANLSGAQGATMDGRDPETIYVPGPVKGFVLDLPLLTDSDAATNPLIYYGASGYGASTFAGAVIYRDEFASGDYEPFEAVDSSARAIWGYASTALPSADPWLWDRGNSVNVSIASGILTSSTEAAIDASPSLNLAYLGGELLQFATATLQTDGSYILTDLKRGRRGTEQFVGTHVVGEDFVLASTLEHDSFGTIRRRPGHGVQDGRAAAG
jgi:hypothetical protein